MKRPIDVYCDMDTSDGGCMVVQRNIKLLIRSGKIMKKDLEIFKAANSGMVLRQCTVLHRQASGS